jgi:2'-hydroxyisoflavone reductase
MKVLVLGGTRFVGRTVVESALARGHDVTVVNRGVSGEVPDGATWRQADRRDPATMRALACPGWDAVVDTWSHEASVVAQSAAALAGSAGWYGYVSSRSVYAWPVAPGSDESAPVVDLGAESGYATDKYGAELAVLEHFAGRCMLARAGLILGPYEDVGRLTWWLNRAARGGDIVAPEPANAVWQYVDARDLAAFLLDGARHGRSGAFDLVCPRSAGATTGRLLAACVAATGDRATPRWVQPEVLVRAGVAEWDDLPGWIAPGSDAAGMHDSDVSAAVAAGLASRSIEETVADTWAWMTTLPARQRGAVKPGVTRPGLTAEQEQSIWWLTS